MNKLWFLFLMIFILGGCATRVPDAISEVPPGNVMVAEARANTTAYIGNRVRWGGEITMLENRASDTLVQIVARKTRKNGKPVADSESSGRFVARFPRFLDPLVYEVGRLITIVGTIEGETTQAIGQYDYSMPIVNVDSSYLWSKEPERVRYNMPPPWYYDPWYDPWYFHRRPYPPYYW